MLDDLKGSGRSYEQMNQKAEEDIAENSSKTCHLNNNNNNNNNHNI